MTNLKLFLKFLPGFDLEDLLADLLVDVLCLAADGLGAGLGDGVGAGLDASDFFCVSITCAALADSVTALSIAFWIDFERTGSINWGKDDETSTGFLEVSKSSGAEAVSPSSSYNLNWKIQISSLKKLVRKKNNLSTFAQFFRWSSWTFIN